MKYKKIYHISDIHIRNTEADKIRYLHVFDNLYNYLETVKSNDALIIITGDILHNKHLLTSISELLTVDFLERLSKIMKVILIAGNHDFNEKNNNIEDSLSSLIYKREFKNLHYLRESGIYNFGNINFGVSSLIDNKFIDAKEIKDGLKIGLYHGMISSSKNSKGFEFSNLSITKFDGYDLTLLGDIHFHQYLNDDKTIAYASSLISQNFSETDINHGVLVWNLEDKTSEYRIINNEYRFEELKLDKSIFHHNKEVKIEDLVLGKYSKLRIISNDNEYYNKVVEKINERYPNISIVQNKLMEKKNINKKNEEFTIKTIIEKEIGNVEEIIRPQIKKILDSELKDAIQSVDEKMNWKLLSLDFSNMLCYGEDNRIDFEKLPLDEITGLYGNNSLGKSSLVDILLFSLYDDYSRNFQDKNRTLSGTLINLKKKYFSCCVKFMMNNKIYEIEKKGQRMIAKTEHVNDTFKFIKYDFSRYEGDEKISMNGQDRFETLKNVIDCIGTYNDFCVSSSCLQNNIRGNIDFLTMSTSDRKVFLNNRIKFDIFKVVENKYKDLLKETLTKIKELERSDDYLYYNYSSEESLIENEKELETINIKLIQDKLKENKKLLDIELSKLIPISEKYRLDIKKLELMKKELVVDKDFKIDDNYIDNLQKRNIELTMKIKQQTNKVYDISRKEFLESKIDNEDINIKKNKLLELKKKYENGKSKNISENILDNIKFIIDTIEINKDNKFEMQELENNKKLLLSKKYSNKENIMFKSINYNLLKDYDKIYNEKLIADANKDVLTLLDNFNPDHDCDNCVKHLDNIKSYYSKINLSNNYDICQERFIEVKKMKEQYEDNIDYMIDFMIEIIDSLKYNNIEHDKSNLESMYEQLKQGSILYNIEKLELEISYIEELEDIKNYIYNMEIIEEIKYNNESIKLYNQNKELYNNYCKIINEIDSSIDSIKMNEKINKKILIYKEEIEKYTEELINTKNKELLLKNEIENIKKDISKYKLCLDKLEKNKQDIKIYELIIKLTGSKGIPRKIINNKLEMIEDEVNSIILPFLGKKIFITREIEDIKVFITDANNIRHNSCGGMENFVISLAFKIAFTSVFNIQSCGLLIIDEGVSVLDKEHIMKFNMISDFLKKYYDYIILITHIDAFHDYTLTKIKIVKKNKDSYLYF